MHNRAIFCFFPDGIEENVLKESVIGNFVVGDLVDVDFLPSSSLSLPASPADFTGESVTGLLVDNGAEGALVST